MTPEILKFYASWACAGNPSNTFSRAGAAAAKLISGTKAFLARHLGCSEDEIIITSGASESNAIILENAVRSSCSTCNEVCKHKKAFCARMKPHIVVSALEHKCILLKCNELTQMGVCTCTFVDPTNDGIIEPQAVRDAIKPNTVLVSVMWANNELGSLNDIYSIADICWKQGVPFHSDVTQIFGKLKSCKVKRLHIDALSVSMHKLFGAKGVGFLYISKRIPFSPLITGAQQNERRGGTENVAAISTIVPALKFVMRHRAAKNKKLYHLCRSVLRGLADAEVDFELVGPKVQRVPHIMMLCFPFDRDWCNVKTIKALTKKGITVSIGSACNSGQKGGSHVLKAIGLNREMYRGIIRISLSDLTSKEDTKRLVKELSAIVKAHQRDPFKESLFTE